MMMNWTLKQRNGARHANAAMPTCTSGLGSLAFYLRPEQPASIDNRQLRH